MAFFDKVSELAKSTTEKAGDKIEISRINGKIRNEQQAIEGFKAELGARYWDMIASGAVTADPSVAEIVDKINNSLSVIEGFEADVARIKEEDARRQAEAEAAKAAAAPIAAPVTAAAPAEPIAPAAEPVADAPAPAGLACTNCGAAINPGARFCQECGTPAPVPAPPAAPAKRFCSNCGTELGAQTRFCPECGAKA